MKGVSRKLDYPFCRFGPLAATARPNLVRAARFVTRMMRGVQEKGVILGTDIVDFALRASLTRRIRTRGGYKKGAVSGNSILNLYSELVIKIQEHNSSYVSKQLHAQICGERLTSQCPIQTILPLTLTGRYLLGKMGFHFRQIILHLPWTTSRPLELTLQQLELASQSETASGVVPILSSQLAMRHDWGQSKVAMGPISA